MYLYLPSGTQKSHLQLFPFSKLTRNEKAYIKSETFYNLYVRNASFLFKKENHIITNDFLLKSDNSFRDATLVSPLLYLLFQAIGNEIYRVYKPTRQKQIQVFYAGNFEKKEPLYKKEYDTFCKVLNIYKDDFDYFIKTDISDFYSSINLNKLISIVDENCKIQGNIFPQHTLQGYKEFISYCGKGKFACTENSIASSFLSRIVYLDKIDTEFFDYLSKNKMVTSFMMIRYVDDLYILCSFNKECNINSIYRSIFEKYSSILKKFDLSINSKKCILEKVKYIGEELRKSIYDEKVKNISFEILEIFAENISRFLDKLIELNLNGNLTFDNYLEEIESFLNIEGFEYSSLEILNQFSYDNKLIIKFPKLKDKLKLLFSGDLTFLSYDPKRLVSLLLKTKDENLIKNLLNYLFKKSNTKNWTHYDSAIVINYLVSRNFIHTDLITTLKKHNSELSSYVDRFCCRSLLEKQNSNILEKICLLASSDWKTCYLYFMYCIEKAKLNYLSSYAFFKNFFDRFTALLAFEIDYSRGRIKGKPNYNLFYKETELSNFYKEITSAQKTIKKAHDIRNQNPMNHASSELIDRSIFSEEILKTINDLKDLMFEFMKLKKIC